MPTKNPSYSGQFNLRVAEELKVEFTDLCHEFRTNMSHALTVYMQTCIESRQLVGLEKPASTDSPQIQSLESKLEEVVARLEALECAIADQKSQEDSTQPGKSRRPRAA
jgi:antitoxin component of RelBE/YafQ-DinJ toxin-antitoxin module